MSLFEWSSEFTISIPLVLLPLTPISPAPERKNGDQILPIVPNEIYLCIFEHIAPPTGDLTSEQLRTFANLSRICRFFANFCLPRIFESVDFSCMFLPHRNIKAVYKTSRETILGTQIAAKQPLALALAKRVRTCHFTDRAFHRMGQGVPLLTDKCIAVMSHMRHIRELRIFQCAVGPEHWEVIASLGSLEELRFFECLFLRGLADLEPEKRVWVKPSRLSVVRCSEPRQLVVAIDVQYLRTLATDAVIFRQIDGLLPQSLEALALFINGTPESGKGAVLKRTLDYLARKNLPLLRSLTLAVDLDASTCAEVRQLSSLSISYGSSTAP